MKVTPKSEDEVSKFELLPDGEYPFTVLDSAEVPSKSDKNKGRMMFALKLNVHGSKFDSHVYDYFADWFGEYKLRHFAATTGRLSDYEAGNLDGTNAAFKDLQGWVKIGHQDAQGGFEAKNVVKDYIVKEKSVVTEKPKDDSDVPF